MVAPADLIHADPFDEAFRMVANFRNCLLRKWSINIRFRIKDVTNTSFHSCKRESSSMTLVGRQRSVGITHTINKRKRH
jgi:hypothetical protein